MLHPKKTKFKKRFKGKISGNEYRVTKLTIGCFGIKILKSGRIKDAQLEAIRKAVLKKLKGKSKIWLRVFPHISVTSKPTEVRMGKGKGAISHWCSPINAGRIIFELQEKSVLIAKELLKITSDKLGLPASLVLK